MQYIALSSATYATKGRGGAKEGTTTHLVAKTGVTASDAVFVAWTYGKTHMTMESRSAELVCVFATWGRRRGRWPVCGWVVVVKVEENGGGSADVGVAAVGVVFDCVGRVEREEREGRTGGLFRALHLQD